MVWKYAKIVYTQITRNTQEPRIMLKYSSAASLHRCIAEWKSADCVDILLGDFAVWNGYVFFFVIVCQIFLQIVSDGSRTDTAGVSAHSDLFFRF